MKRGAGALLCAGSSAALAAGGQFDVDDATMLAPGHCQVETWLLRGRSPALESLHFGPACHLAGLEWGLNADGVRAEGRRIDSAGVQMKWVADPAAQRLSLGAAWAVNRRLHGDRRPLVTAYVPMTAWLGGDGALQVHLNLGQDRDPTAGVWRRWGAATDWTVSDSLMFTVERRFQSGAGLTRVGTRWSLNAATSIDFSAASDAGTRVFIVGLNWEWVR